jgi:hypothetical protein
MFIAMFILSIQDVTEMRYRSPRLLKKVQMQGGAPKAGVPIVDGSRRTGGTPQRVPRPANAARRAFSLSRRLLKKVQMQGGALMPERGVLHVRRNEWQGGPTPQMGLFQQPAVRYSTAAFHIR